MAEYFNSYRESEDAIMSLSDDEAGRLYKAKFLYFFDEVKPDFSDNVRLQMVWSYERAKLDRDKHSIYVQSVANSYKTYLRDLPEGEQRLNREGWLIAQKNNVIQREYPNIAIDQVTLEDMRRLDLAELKKQEKELRKRKRDASEDDYTEVY